MYKRLAEVRADEDVDLLAEEMLDRYGAPPDAVTSLLLVARFRARARQAGIGEVTIAGKHVRFAPVTLADSRVVRLQRLHPGAIVKTRALARSWCRARRPRSSAGGRSLGCALLEWARQVIDAVLDPPDRTEPKETS